MTLKAAIYARYSSDLQSIRSIEDQIALCRQHLEQKSWTETVVYSDRAISGGAMVTRPGIQDLIRGAANGHFNVVVSEALDRHSHNLQDPRLSRRVDRHAFRRRSRLDACRLQGRDE